MRREYWQFCLGLFLTASALLAQSPGNVLVVVNDNSAISRSIGEYYAERRSVPLRNICHIHTTSEEAIERGLYLPQIAEPIANCLKKNGLVDSILYIVTTLGVPLTIPGTDGVDGDTSSVDSELTLLYSDITRGPHPIPGSVPNPFFGHTNDKFTHASLPHLPGHATGGVQFRRGEGRHRPFAGGRQPGQIRDRYGRQREIPTAKPGSGTLPSNCRRSGWCWMKPPRCCTANPT